jgi:hypothetical protein
VIRWIGNVTQTLVKTGRDIIGGFITGVGRKLFDAATLFGRLAFRILLWIGNVTGTLTRKGTEIIGGFLVGIGRKIVDVATWFGGLARRALVWIGNMQTTLLQKGSDLIGGFLQGVLNRMRNISSWVNDHVVKPIIDAVKKFFGIHSPSTVFEGLGVNMIAGLLKGLSSGARLDIAKKIFGSVPNALAAMVSKGIIGIQGLPRKALDALGSVSGIIAGGFSVGDLERITYQGKTLQGGTLKALYRAQQLLGGRFNVMQGSFNTSVGASKGTHRGGGVVDLDNDGSSWAGAVAALRHVGFAAWHRDPSQGPWGHHIHAVQIGNPTLSPEAAAQVQSYLRGGNGLAGYAMGAWKLLTSHLAMVHRGEMVVPAGPAEEIRRVVKGSTGRPSGTVGTTTTIVNNYIIEAPNYVGDKDDLVKALDQLNRRGRLPAPFGRSA